MKKYLIRDRFTGIELDKREKFDEALKLLEVYENDDKKNGTFEPESYEIEMIEE